MSKKDYISHIVWADNWFLFAKSIEEAREMLTELTEEIATLALFWKASSASMIGSLGGGKRSKAKGAKQRAQSNPLDLLKRGLNERRANCHL